MLAVESDLHVMRDHESAAAIVGEDSAHRRLVEGDEDVEMVGGLGQLSVAWACGGRAWSLEDWDQPGYAKESGKRTRIDVCSLKRPHMRAFHLAWLRYASASRCLFDRL